jgi:ABC-type nitrate/sulfonate/bicarbonate transport system substrate-binding protein
MRALLLTLLLAACDHREAPLRMGYFHGGRNTLLYRAMDDGAYERAGVDVVFRATRSPTDPVFVDLPRRLRDFERAKSQKGAGMMGRTTGPQIVAEIEAGNLECGMIGESTFLTVVDEGLPWSAIARLGQDTRESAGKVVVVRSDLPIEGPADLRGSTFGSRESGPYDQVMVREFLSSRGVDPSSMVILDQIPPDDLKRMLEDQELDLAFLHLVNAAQQVERGNYRLYPGFAFDFADPALSQSLLVCPNEVVQAHRDALVRFIAAFIRRVRHERSLPARERSRFSGSKSFGMDLTFFEDFNIPQYSERPLIQVDLLAEMQRLLLKHGMVGQARDVAPFVDNSLVQEAIALVEAEPDAPYPGAVLTVLPGSPAARLIAVLDQDGDGRFSTAEFEAVAHSSRRAADWDHDADGFIDEAEMRVLLAQVSPLIEGYRGKDRHQKRAAETEEEGEDEGSLNRAIRSFGSKKGKDKARDEDDG